jgi:replicative DNA helicase
VTTRNEIERYVLGCMLVDAAAVAQVIDVIKPNNFKHSIGSVKTKQQESFGITHAMVYHAVLRLYPTRSVNILGVTRELQHMYHVQEPRLLMHCVAALTDTVGNTTAITEYALVLVQESIKENVEHWVNTKVAEAQKEVQLVTADASDPRIQREQDFAQIRHRLQLMPDVFDQVDALRSFFKNYGYTEELEEVEAMAANINERTKQIRAKHYQNNQLNYVRHLAKQCNYPEAAEQLMELAFNIIDGTCHPSMKLTNHINQLGAIA